MLNQLKIIKLRAVVIGRTETVSIDGAQVTESHEFGIDRDNRIQEQNKCS
jgi:hypothetical protein